MVGFAPLLRLWDKLSIARNQMLNALFNKLIHLVTAQIQITITINDNSNKAINRDLLDTNWVIYVS